MTLYAIFDRTPNKDIAPAAVPEGFSWFAALLPPIYALAQGLWLMLVIWLVGTIGLTLVSDLIGDGASRWLYLLFALFLGFEAATFRRAALRRKGWHYKTEIVAGAEDVALVEYLKQK